METTSVASSTYASGMGATGSTTSSSASSAEEAYDLFLSLLVTQLESQNPLDPVDTDEMTSQLISYSQVEQQIQTNDYLESLVLSTNEQSAETALSFVGKDVTYSASTQGYTGEDATWSMTVPVNAESMTFEVFDENGLKVHETTASPEAGSAHDFIWDGATSAGGQADPGSYTLVATAALQGGGTTAVGVQSTSRANEVTWASGDPQLMLANGDTIGLDKIVSAADPNA